MLLKYLSSQILPRSIVTDLFCLLAKVTVPIMDRSSSIETCFPLRHKDSHCFSLTPLLWDMNHLFTISYFKKKSLFSLQI